MYTKWSLVLLIFIFQGYDDGISMLMCIYFFRTYLWWPSLFRLLWNLLNYPTVEGKSAWYMALEQKKTTTTKKKKKKKEKKKKEKKGLSGEKYTLKVIYLPFGQFIY